MPETHEPRGRYIFIDYTNWRLERGLRKIIPQSLAYESSQWHPQPQYVLKAYDCDRRELRSFAFATIHGWNAPAMVTDEEWEPTVQPGPDYKPHTAGDVLALHLQIRRQRDAIATALRALERAVHTLNSEDMDFGHNLVLADELDMIIKEVHAV